MLGSLQEKKWEETGNRQLHQLREVGQSPAPLPANLHRLQRERSKEGFPPDGKQREGDMGEGKQKDEKWNRGRTAKDGRQRKQKEGRKKEQVGQGGQRQMSPKHTEGPRFPRKAGQEQQVRWHVSRRLINPLLRFHFLSGHIMI